MAAGHGGQILVADSTAVLLSGVDLSIWGRDGCGICQRRLGCSRSVRRVCARTFRHCVESTESRKFASGDHELDRPRRRGLAIFKRPCARIGW